MAVSMEDIKKLRAMSGAGLADVKKALTEADGDFDQAMKLIRERGQAIAAKRSDREASEGCVLAGTNGNFAAVIALCCETDFVAKNADFVALAKNILEVALSTQPSSVEELKNATIEGRTIAELVAERSGVTGEKMELSYYEIVSGETVVAYNHLGNKLATVVAFAEANVETVVARNIAMQAAAMAPIALDRDSVSAEVVEKEKEIAREKARQEGKPEAILDKIAEGRLNKFYQESVLLEQASIAEDAGKDSVAAYLKKNNATCIAFKRVTLNEE